MSRSDKVIAQQYKLPVRAVEVMRSLPGYDPFALARQTDYINLDEGERFVELYNEHICIPDGELAGKPMPLEWWQEAACLNIYSWFQEDGFRRFREWIYYVGKKNSKTSHAAAIAAIHFKYYAPFGAQFYSAAATREQAGLFFSAWHKILHFSPDLREGIEVFGAKGPGTVKSIVMASESKSYKPMSRDADSGDGVGPDFLVIDELHRHKDGELMETLEKSTAAKRNALIIKTSTADYDRPSPCNRMVQRARLICQNDGDPAKPGYAPRTLPCIFEVSPQEFKDDPECWKKMEVWKKANPNFGVTITEDFANEQIQLAIDDSSTLNNMLRLHLNIVTTLSEVWIDMEKWDVCKPSTDDGSLLKKPCYGGFDLSANNDLTSFCIAWRHPEGGYECRWWFWIPSDRIEEREKRDGVPYRVWERDGWIEFIPGEVIDMEVVQDRILSICKEYKVKEVGADPWNNSATMQFLEKRGVKVLQFRQGPATITEPGKEMLRHIIGGNFRHGSNPVARWNASNAMIKHAPNDTFSLDKAKCERRIDGIAAAIMAVGMAMRHGGTASAYAGRGVMCGGFDD